MLILVSRKVCCSDTQGQGRQDIPQCGISKDLLAWRVLQTEPDLLVVKAFVHETTHLLHEEELT